MLGVLYAMFLIQSVLYTFLLTETLATFVGISVLGGIVWPRANRWGALASLLSALATNFLLYYVSGQRLDHWDANVFLAALLAGILALVVVSLLTPPGAGGEDRFLLHAPADVERWAGRRRGDRRGERASGCPSAAPARQPPASSRRRRRSWLARVPRGPDRLRHRLGHRVRARRGDGGLSEHVRGAVREGTEVTGFDTKTRRQTKTHEGCDGVSTSRPVASPAERPASRIESAPEIESTVHLSGALDLPCTLDTARANARRDRSFVRLRAHRAFVSNPFSPSPRPRLPSPEYHRRR